MGLETLHVGVLWVRVDVIGSQSLKDRRRVLRSLRDRSVHRFDVSCHEVATDEHRYGQLVFSTAGAEAVVVRSALDKVRSFLESQPGCVVVDLRFEVMPWRPDAPSLWPVVEDQPDV
jgi:uncharacterized protein YlxP (DUF503 family)